MNDVSCSLSMALDRLPISKWGIGDISGLHPISEEYPKAIALLLAYRAPRDEEELKLLLHQTHVEMRRQTDALATMLKDLGVKHFIASWPADNQTLTAGLSNKLVATRAGLGWIGKSCLLVTKEYGPRVRLATILVDEDLPCAEPITKSNCGGCHECVDACPHGCLTGAIWRPGMSRDELLDARLCYTDGTELRTRPCGYCLMACPWGTSSRVG